MKRYQAFFDSNMMGVATTDFQDTILSANDAFLSMIGYTRRDLETGKLRWSTISPRKYTDIDEEKVNELLLKKSIVPFEKEYIHKKGRIVPVLVGAEALDDTLSFGVCFALDISSLKELEQKKDDFIGIVSHELKTPISIMKLYAGFLKDSIENKASTEELLELTNEVSNQVDKLNVLISDLLNMARSEAHEAGFPVGAVDFCDTAQNVVTELSQINDRNIKFSCGKPFFVNGNKERIGEVITNLINNALCYSTEEVSVEVTSDESFGYVHITDKGKGITEEDQKKIFDRYYRVNHADDYATKSMGIGLYISQEIMRQHKGRITLQSEVGKGSTFTIELPLL